MKGHITPITIRGLGTLQQRAYLLLSLAVGGLTAHENSERQSRAVSLWGRFVRQHPEFESPLINTQQREGRGCR